MSALHRMTVRWIHGVNGKLFKIAERGTRDGHKSVQLIVDGNLVSAVMMVTHGRDMNTELKIRYLVVSFLNFFR